jgi:hypothetical protein
MRNRVICKLQTSEINLSRELESSSYHHKNAK